MNRQSARFTSALALTALTLTGVVIGGCSSPEQQPEVVSVGGASSQAATTAAPDNQQRIKQYRECLQAQGVVLLDYPTAEGLPQIDKNRTVADKLPAAMAACREFVPSGGDAQRPAQSDIEARQRYAACVREHGIAEYPDPDPQTGDPRISDELGARLKNDPRTRAAMDACDGILVGAGTVGG
ncbi:MAG: hypothetical protein ABW215_04785 [Kibdelosporangium sp.]